MRARRAGRRSGAAIAGRSAAAGLAAAGFAAFAIALQTGSETTDPTLTDVYAAARLAPAEPGPGARRRRAPGARRLRGNARVPRLAGGVRLARGGPSRRGGRRTRGDDRLLPQPRGRPPRLQRGRGRAHRRHARPAGRSTGRARRTTSPAATSVRRSPGRRTATPASSSRRRRCRSRRWSTSQLLGTSSAGPGSACG